MTRTLPGRAWPEADRLFREDPLWVGGDGSYSFPIGADRVVWIFADSFIAARPGAGRTRDATMINNSVGVQDGPDPASATMTYSWRTGDGGRPASFFDEGQRGSYLWPCNGVLLDGRLLLFAMRVRPREMTPEEARERTSLSSFDVYDWAAIVVENPLEEPARWRVTYRDHADSRFATTIGAGSVFLEGDHVYAHATARASERDQYLARWARDAVAADRLDLPEWWCGEALGWLREPDIASGAEPKSTVVEPQTEFTVHRDTVTGRLTWAQTLGVFGADIGIRVGDRPEGPWSEFTPVYHPPEGDPDGGFVYGAKAHPEQGGAGDDLVLTYNNNALRVQTLMERPELYFPTFVRIPEFHRRTG